MSVVGMSLTCWLQVAADEGSARVYVPQGKLSFAHGVELRFR
jgi:hypothetical protein